MHLLKLLALGALNLSTSPNLEKFGPNRPRVTEQSLVLYYCCC